MLDTGLIPAVKFSLHSYIKEAGQPAHGDPVETQTCNVTIWSQAIVTTRPGWIDWKNI